MPPKAPAQVKMPHTPQAQAGIIPPGGPGGEAVGRCLVARRGAKGPPVERGSARHRPLVHEAAKRRTSPLRVGVVPPGGPWGGGGQCGGGRASASIDSQLAPTASEHLKGASGRGEGRLTGVDK